MNGNKIAGLAIWNAILSVLVFMLIIALWQTQEDLKLERELTQMGHDSQYSSLMEIAAAVAKNSESITRNSESGWAIFEYSNTLYDKIVRDVADIYQGHIVPIRAILMESEDD